MSAHILSIGLAPPRLRLGAQPAITLASLLAAPGVSKDTIEALHRRSGIAERGCAILDANGDQPLYRADNAGIGPTTAERLAPYTASAAELAATAAREALQRASIEPARITHLVTASCTGFDAPGFDQNLVRDVGLGPMIRRTHIGFMGCHAAINALAVASAFAQADRNAVVLLCCVELCSLHYHYSARVDQLIANALFADGAAAAVISARAPHDSPILGGFSASVFEGSENEMTWRIGDHGFEMTLAPTIPETLRRVVPAWVRAMLDSHDLSRRGIGGWAIHPGGPRIVRAVTDALDLSPEHGNDSLGVLRHHGNMSSPTILFILRELWERGAPRPWIALAFGPGVAGEAALIR
jgi:predicted naringenin-chalcone synthase